MPNSSVLRDTFQQGKHSVRNLKPERTIRCTRTLSLNDGALAVEETREPHALPFGHFLDILLYFKIFDSYAAFS